MIFLSMAFLLQLPVLPSKTAISLCGLVPGLCFLTSLPLPLQFDLPKDHRREKRDLHPVEPVDGRNRKNFVV